MSRRKRKPWDGRPLDTAGLARIKPAGRCRECGRAPAKVVFGNHLTLCGVCWNRLCWLRWAQRELGVRL